MADRTSDPPGRGTERPRKGTDPARAGRIKPEQFEIKVRWEKGRRVRKVSPTGVQFDFDSALKVGVRYPISLNAPGVSFSSTLEVTRCQVILEPGGKRYFSIEGRFFPYVE
ncbi:MAG TPA: hypothetical protein VER78_07830 [Thermoanaerobaculia bacterium]|nr:hypothetical protein [Thermoanaerobaculia bacterium]